MENSHLYIPHRLIRGRLSQDGRICYTRIPPPSVCADAELPACPFSPSHTHTKRGGESPLSWSKSFCCHKYNLLPQWPSVSFSKCPFLKHRLSIFHLWQLTSIILQDGNFGGKWHFQEKHHFVWDEFNLFVQIILVLFILLFKIVLDKTASAARNWKNSSPPNSSDDLCLLFCLFPPFSSDRWLAGFGSEEDSLTSWLGGNSLEPQPPRYRVHSLPLHTIVIVGTYCRYCSRCLFFKALINNFVWPLLSENLYEKNMFMLNGHGQVPSYHWWLCD